jgi:hypothetical protein
MTVKNFWMNATTTDAEAFYYVIPAQGREWQITRAQAAQFTFDPEFPFGWRVERRIVESEVTACPWCGARPVIFERDVDGWASTGTCGSEQCNGLRRCDGCGKDNCHILGSVRGHLCDTCNETARKNGLEAAPDRYALVASTW